MRTAHISASKRFSTSLWPLDSLHAASEQLLVRAYTHVGMELMAVLAAQPSACASGQGVIRRMHIHRPPPWNIVMSLWVHFAYETEKPTASYAVGPFLHITSLIVDELGRRVRVGHMFTDVVGGKCGGERSVPVDSWHRLPVSTASVTLLGIGLQHRKSTI